MKVKSMSVKILYSLIVARRTQKLPSWIVLDFNQLVRIIKDKNQVDVLISYS